MTFQILRRMLMIQGNGRYLPSETNRIKTYKQKQK